MTEPLTPVDCDLRDFAYMPLDVVRLRDSDLAIQVSGEEFRSAVMLWCASWHQVPAGSLPNDDKSLAALAGLGRVVTEWMKQRDGALRGWIECSDGRLYHPVVAEKALEAWSSKQRHAYQKLGERVRKLNKIRAEKGLLSIVVPSFDDWFSAGMPTEKELLPPENIGSSGGKDDDFRDDEGGNPAEFALKGEGKGKGYIKKTSPHNPPETGKQETLTAKKARVKAERTTLQTFLSNCKTRGEKPISDYEPLARYMAESGLPADFVNLCWAEFKREFLPGGKSERKQQALWRRHFQNFVERNFFKLWYAKPHGDGVVYELTTAGLQAQAAQKHREAA